MFPTIFAPNSSEFESHGLGMLVDALTCEVTEERNGIYELTLTYPVGGHRAEALVVGGVIKATAHRGDSGQLFEIYEINTAFNGSIEVHARHISYRLSYIPCSPFSASNVLEAFSKLPQNMTETGGFSFVTTLATNGSLKIEKPTNVRSVLGGEEGSILDTYHGEYEFNNFVVRLYGNRGSNKGVVLRYGKNITDISQDQEISEVYTGLYPYYSSDEEYVELPEKVVYCNNASAFAYHRVLILDCSNEFMDSYGDPKIPTVSEMRGFAQKYMNDHKFGIPEVNLTVNFDAQGVSDLEYVLLCDTVTVFFPALGVSSSSKVVKTVYDSILDKYKSIELGSLKSNLASTMDASINSSYTKASIELLDTRNHLEKAQERATATLLGRNGGYKVEKTNDDGQIIETLYMDTLDEATASKIWRWNINGLGYSPTGTQGPYIIAMTKDGEIVADFITTGVLDAAQVDVVNLKAQNVLVDSSTTLTSELSSYNTRIEANAQGLSSKVSTTDYTGNKVVSMINQTATTVSISAGKINLNGAVTANNNVTISTDGKITAQNATISGAITATSLTLGSGASVSASKVSGLSTVATSGKYTDLSNKPDLTVYVSKDGTIGSTPSEGATGFKVSSAGLLEASNAIIYGTVYASNGRIAKWDISSTEIGKTFTETSGTTYTQHRALMSSPSSYSSGTVAFSVRYRTSTNSGSTYSSWSNNFYVTYGGKLYASDAEISGKITATEGTIGRFNITDTYLNTGTGSNNAGMGGNQAFWAGNTSSNNAPFRVAYDGTLVATNATITGKITATEGTIGGCVIDANGNLTVKNANIESINGDKVGSGINGSNISNGTVAEGRIDGALLRTSQLGDKIASLSVLNVTSVTQNSHNGRFTINGLFTLLNADATYTERHPMWFKMKSASEYASWTALRTDLADKYLLIGTASV